jgi:plastocyanin
MRGWLVLCVAGLAGAAAAVVPALASDQTVNATPGNTWAPATVTVDVGDTVTFANTGGTHNLHFDGEPASNDPSALPWTIKRRFDRAGAFTFACDVHRNMGMVGEVVVAAPATSTTTTPTTPTTPASAFSARPVRGLFCTHRSRTCKHPGITVRMRLDAPATVTGAVSRLVVTRNEFRRFGTLRFRLRAGRHSVRFLRTREHRLLRPGGYRVDLTALGRVVRVSFMVRPS